MKLRWLFSRRHCCRHLACVILVVSIAALSLGILSVLDSIITPVSIAPMSEPRIQRSVVSGDVMTQVADLRVHRKYSTPYYNGTCFKNGPCVLYNYSLAVTSEDIQNFQATLPPLLKYYKNPCWMEPVPQTFTYKQSYYAQPICSGGFPIFNRTFSVLDRIINNRKRQADGSPCWRMRCFPYFFVVGAPKAGTTDLYNSLVNYHPHIRVNLKKESQFWTDARFGSYTCRDGPATFADYLDLYDLPAEHMFRSLQQRAHIVGEFTPRNYNKQITWRRWAGNINQSEPRVTLADHIYHIRPETKVIFCVREPVARAISHYHFSGDPSSIGSYFDKRLKTFKACLDTRPLRYCVYTNQVNIHIGMYYVYIKDWLQVFPRDQVYVMYFEQYAANRSQVIDDITDFLKIDRLDSGTREKLEQANVKRAVGANAHKGGNQTVPENVIKMLQDFYRPWNRRLANLLQDNRFLWNY